MNLGLLADLHFRGKDWKTQTQAFEAALAEMKSCDVAWVLCAGDVFDRPGIADRDASLGRLVRAFLDPVEKHKLPILIVGGNHDRPGQTSEPDCLEILRHHPLCRVVSRRPEHITLKRGNDYALIAAYPWLTKADCPDGAHNFRRWYREELAQTQKIFEGRSNIYKVFLAHCELQGAYSNYQFVLPGSTYCFHPNELESLGANLIALGHVHNRQSYYLGALIQLDFGEERNPTGWLHVDTITGIKEFRPLDQFRKFYTVLSTHYDPAKYRACDKVKVRGKVRPEKLEEGTVFEKQIDARTIQPRNSFIDPSNSLRKLFDTWADANGVDVIQAHYDALGAVSEGVEETCVMNGSLEAIEEIRLSGFGPHEMTYYEFTSDNGWWAITGENGAGKSFFLETIIAALYGKWAKPGRKLSNTLTKSAGLVQVIFRAAGARWKVTREVKSKHRTSQTVHIYKWEDNKWEDKAGPGTKAVAPFVERLCGPYNLFLGSAFLAQKSNYDIISLGNTERMAFVRQFLGLSKYDKMADRARTEVSKWDQKLQHLQQTCLDFRTQESALVSHENEISDLHTRIEFVQNKLSRIKDMRDQLNEHKITKNNEIIDQIADVNAKIRILQDKKIKASREQTQLLNSLTSFEQKYISKHRTTAAQIQRAKEQQEDMKSVGCVDQGYLPCRFINKAINAVSELPKLEEMVRRLELVLEQRPWENTQEAIRIQELEDLIESCNRDVSEGVVQVEKLKRASGLEKLDHHLQQVQHAENQLRQTEEELYSLLQQRGMLEERIRVCELKLEKLKECTGKLTATEEALKIHTDVAKAVGKNGIPQLLISVMIPALQDILNDVCSEDFDGRFGLRLDTVKELKKGGEEETFSIIFMKNGHEYDAGCCSGGEETVVKAALRTALILYQADKTARGYRVCFLDEPTAHQDQRNAEATIKMIQRLQERFKQVLIVSHVDTLLSGFPNHIHLGDSK